MVSFDELKSMKIMVDELQSELRTHFLERASKCPFRGTKNKGSSEYEHFICNSQEHTMNRMSVGVGFCQVNDCPRLKEGG